MNEETRIGWALMSLSCVLLRAVQLGLKRVSDSVAFDMGIMLKAIANTDEKSVASRAVVDRVNKGEIKEALADIAIFNFLHPGAEKSCGEAMDSLPVVKTLFIVYTLSIEEALAKEIIHQTVNN